MTRPVFGAYDPLYPNGIASFADGDNIFGLRVLTMDTETGEIAEGRTLDEKSYRIGPIYGDRYYHMEWAVNGKRASISWGRTDEVTVYGTVTCEPGLKLVLEQYIPREYRLKNRWANFCRLGPCLFTGEMISPYDEAHTAPNAVRLLVSREPESTCGYNDREKQLADLRETGTLRNIRRPRIWDDMGLSWLQGMLWSGSVSFEYRVGRAEEFLDLRDGGNAAERIARGIALVEDAKAREDEEKLTGSGILQDVPEAVEASVSFNTMYREDTGRRYIMVDRPWARNEDGWGTVFNWDTFLSSLSTVWFDEELAKENILSAFDCQLPDGKIPLFTSQQMGHTNEPPITAGRCQHIVHGLVIWRIYLRTLDRAWLRECYGKLKRLHAWWFADRGDGQAYRDAGGLGLLGFGYDCEKEMGVLGATVTPYAAKAQFAYFETYDDSPQWTTGAFFRSVKGMRELREEDVSDVAKYLEKTHTANIYTLERCCLYAAEAEALAKMAAELGQTEDEETFRKQHAEMAERVNRYMWNEEDGCYYNYSFDGHQVKMQTPDCFLPILAGIADEEKTDRLMKLLLDPKKFWGEWKVPSVAADDPHFPEQHYWRGQIWPPLVLWTYLSLRRAGRRKEAAELAETSSGMLMLEWRESCSSPENFNAITGRSDCSPHYNWGTLMGTIALDEMLQLEPGTVTFGDTCLMDGTALKGIRLDGHRYDVRKENGCTVVVKDGVEAARSEGPVVFRRG